MANKKAIILGGYGQDGSFMHELLVKKGYNVFIIGNDRPYDIHFHITLVQPDEIYNFAGVSNVINPYKSLNEVFEINAKLPQQILEAIYKVNKNIKYFQASSALIFGKDKSGYQNEETSYNPIYPYGAAKLYATNITKMFRDDLGLFACSGIFFPHESERRGEHFFTKKITHAAATKTKVVVGSLKAKRDFGYAPDYVEAAYLMLQNNIPTDYCIGTGELTSIEDFAKKSFDYVGLNYKDYVKVDESKTRINEAEILCANISKIKDEIGWKPTKNIDEIIHKMIDNDRLI